MKRQRKGNTIYSYALPVEFKVVAIRECPVPFSQLVPCTTASHAADYWRAHVQTMETFNPECECLTAIFLDSRHRIKGHQLLTFGTMNTILVHPREVFRTAIIASAFSLVLVHNHPSGDPNPSIEDITVTRNLVKAGELIKVNVLDHIIIGAEQHLSLRELGVFN